MKHYCLVAVTAILTLNSYASADVIPTNVRAIADTGSLGGIANDTISGFGTATAAIVPFSSSTITTSAPVLDAGAQTVTISGTASVSGSQGTSGGSVQSDFDLTVGCDFNYSFMATMTETLPAGIPSAYSISAGANNALSLLPLPGTSPLSINGVLVNGSTTSFQFQSLIADFPLLDGFGYDYTFELVLSAVDPANCNCSTVPEPSAWAFMSLLGVGCVAWKKRNQIASIEAADEV